MAKPTALRTAVCEHDAHLRAALQALGSPAEGRAAVSARSRFRISRSCRVDRALLVDARARSGLAAAERGPRPVHRRSPGSGTKLRADDPPALFGNRFAQRDRQPPPGGDRVGGRRDPRHARARHRWILRARAFARPLRSCARRAASTVPGSSRTSSPIRPKSWGRPGTVASARPRSWRSSPG